jgi:gliding motility-associated-like protein
MKNFILFSILGFNLFSSSIDAFSKSGNEIKSVLTDTLPPVTLCSYVDSYDLFRDIAIGTNFTGTWTDVNTPVTGALSGHTLDLTKLTTGTFFFRYVATGIDKILQLRYTKQPTPAVAEAVSLTCKSKIDLYDALKPGTYTTGTWWAVKNGSNIKLDSSQVTLKSGSNYFFFHVKGNGVCYDVITPVNIKADSIKPLITCKNGLTRETLRGVGNYEVIGKELDATGDDSECHLYKLSNSLNNDSTLADFKMSGGSYQITWNIQDSLGNSATCLSEITIISLHIPNLISPNNDGHNDTWDFDVSISYPDAVVYIYNRAGQMVYKSKEGYPEKWNGNSSDGKKLPDDSYVYILVSNGKDIAKGTVTIMR